MANEFNAKDRPGVRVNFKNGRQPTVLSSTRGIVVVPLIGYDWGPRGQWIVISADSPNSHVAELGRSVYDSDSPAMLMLQLILLNAQTVYAYILDGGTAATKDVTVGSKSLKVTAKYKGTLGNTVKIVSVANPVSGFDVSVLLNGSEIETFEGIETMDELKDKSEYVDFSGTGEMAAFASATLAGGTDTVSGNSGISDFLDKSEKIRFNCMCFPSTDASLQAALLTKIKYIRETIGWKCQAVAPNFAADYEGIINLVNSFVYGEQELTTAEACAWLAGATAGADKTDDLTYAVVTNATSVVGELNNEEAVASIKKGETYFSIDDTGAVILEYDINSRITISADDPQDIYKNRPCRVYDNFANDLRLNFRPGKYRARSEDYPVVEGIGRTMLQSYQDDGALSEVDLENDFLVDTGKSVGDLLYFNVGLKAVDSAAKYFFNITSR